MRKEYLKIRDDVDLKELEKFGFYYECFAWVNPEEIYFWKCRGFNYAVSIYEDRTIHIIRPSKQVYILLFDLISAGLVKKVVEDE